MIPNNSPWIKQLNRTRPVLALDHDVTTDIAIVGGGIAGVTTAYFLLRDSEYSVTLLEADKVAHGATGHNAGQVVSYFERPFSELVDEFGLELASQGQQSIESSWSLLDEIRAETRLRTPLYKFLGQAGCSSLEQVLLHLKNNLLRRQGGLDIEDILVAEELDEENQIPTEYKDLYAVVPQEYLLSLLETNNPKYIASIAFPKGCMNSALFTEEIVGYLLTTYSERFTLFEGSPVTQVILQQDNAQVTVGDQTVETKRVVLCTNGFEKFIITNSSGRDINTKYHTSIAGRVGYMVGYVEPLQHLPTAISYFSTPGTDEEEPYFYLTRRRHEHEPTKAHSLICIGGPEEPLEEVQQYSRENYCSEIMRDTMDTFLKENYKYIGEEPVDYVFCWHGLMGYTPNGVRCIGVEPRNEVLLYNLGCNGVGILPSIYGGQRISQIMTNQNVGKSIFDPRDRG